MKLRRKWKSRYFIGAGRRPRYVMLEVSLRKTALLYPDSAAMAANHMLGVSDLHLAVVAQAV